MNKIPKYERKAAQGCLLVGGEAPVFNICCNAVWGTKISGFCCLISFHNWTFEMAAFTALGRLQETVFC